MKTITARPSGAHAARPSGAHAAPPPPQTSWAQRLIPPHAARWVALPTALLAALLVHYPALGTFFAQDDLTFLARARGLEPWPVSFGRLLSGALRWRAFNALFGLNPLPYHAANMLMHLANVALVYAVARRMVAGRAAAWAAAVLFGASGIAFTPLHWATGLGEIMATSFALAALLLYLMARGAQADGTRRRAPTHAATATQAEGPAADAARAPGAGTLLVLSALAVLAAGLSKETVLLLPLVLFAADRRLGLFPPRLRALAPAALAGLVFLAGFLATLGSSDYLGGQAYALSFSPVFLVQNFATYMGWLIVLWAPVRDAVASMDPGALIPGLVLAALFALVLWSQRRAPRHPEEVGAVWFLVLLAPVLPLRHHTYLYYLYLPWAGVCWLLAGLGARLVRRVPLTLLLLLAAVAAFAGVEARNVRTREVAMTGVLMSDRTMRESTMLRNVTTALDTVGLAPDARIAFVNPAPPLHSPLAGRQTGPRRSYVPLEAALRGGRALQLRFPRLRYLGFADTLPRDWEDAEVFLFQDDGSARHLGHGSQALSELGYFTIRTRQWERADAMLRRSLALGDTLPDAVFGLAITSSYLGREPLARLWAREFERRFPGDPRARFVQEELARPDSLGAKPAR